MSSTHDQLNWNIDGIDWPNRSSSRFVHAAGLRWHVQQMGAGPPLLLLHGTGAATHSWRDIAPLLAAHFTVFAPDLPGHGFTERMPAKQLSLAGMSQALKDLLLSQHIQPAVVAGHSAGAAIAVRMALDHYIAPDVLVSLNGALLPPQGLPGLFFSPVAKLVAKSPLVPRLFAWRAKEKSAVMRLLDSTGSKLTPDGIAFYTRLVSNETHVRNVLDMMANWSLRSIEVELARLTTPLWLVVGTDDRTVPPSEARRVQALLPSAVIVTLKHLGHLAHEEQPQQVATLIMQAQQAVIAAKAS